MAIDGDDKISKFIHHHYVLGSIASSTAGYRIFKSVPNLAINSVNSVIKIRTVTGLHFLLRRLSTVYTVFLGNIPYLFFRQLERQISFSGSPFETCKKLIERRFSGWKFIHTPTTPNSFSILISKIGATNNFFVSTIAPAQPKNSIFFGGLKQPNNSKFPVFISSFIQKCFSPICFKNLSHHTPATYLVFSKMNSGNYFFVTAITSTQPRSLFFPRFSTPSYYSKHPKSFSGNVLSKSSFWHSVNSLRGDLRRLAMLLSRQHLFKSTEVMKTKIAHRYSCLDRTIVLRFSGVSI